MVHVDEAERGGSVGKVLLHVTMSLDGFIAGPDDAMDWVFEYSEPDKTADEIIRTTGSDRTLAHPAPRHRQASRGTQPQGLKRKAEPAGNGSSLFQRASGDTGRVVLKSLARGEHQPDQE
jgi:hypothetical protein